MRVVGVVPRTAIQIAASTSSPPMVGRTIPPIITSGIRLGTPAGTTRGFGPMEFRKIGALIAEVVDGLSRNGPEGDAQVEESVRRRVAELCADFPVYPGL